jgi:hypothetical protein
MGVRCQLSGRRSIKVVKTRWTQERWHSRNVHRAKERWYLSNTLASKTLRLRDVCLRNVLGSVGVRLAEPAEAVAADEDATEVAEVRVALNGREVVEPRDHRVDELGLVAG